MKHTSKINVQRQYQRQKTLIMVGKPVWPSSIAVKRMSSMQSPLLCFQLRALRYHNYAQYLTNWQTALAQNNISTNMTDRPVPVGTLYDNTTVQGNWIDVQDMAANSDGFDRIINNVSLAMPHAGVFTAAGLKRNAIIQPQDLSVGLMESTQHEKC